MYVDWEYYKIFYYVAKYQNFTKAARVLGNNQPNITPSMNRLESQLNCVLFIRSNRGVTLTPEGERLYSRIASAAVQIQDAEEELSASATLEHGAISISATETALNIYLSEPIVVIAHDDPCNACVDDHALAHGATYGVFHIVAGRDLLADKIQRGVDHLIARGADDGGCFRMYAAAQFIAFTAGNISFHAHAFADIRAVFSATRRTDIAGGDHFIFFYDHSAVVTSKACAALGNGLSQIQIVVRFISPMDIFLHEEHLTLHSGTPQSETTHIRLRIIVRFCAKPQGRHHNY